MTTYKTLNIVYGDVDESAPVAIYPDGAIELCDAAYASFDAMTADGVEQDYHDFIRRVLDEVRNKPTEQDSAQFDYQGVRVTALLTD